MVSICGEQELSTLQMEMKMPQASLGGFVKRDEFKIKIDDK
jgi:hypothetical protein